MLLEYQRIIKEIPASQDLGFFTRVTRFGFTDMWYTHVKNETLSRMGIHWFEPELLLHCLMQIKPSYSQTHSYLYDFLDELIHTHAQKSNPMLKALRCNILFSEYLNKLKKDDKQYLIKLIKLEDSQQAKENFINNCVISLFGRRLFEMECVMHCNFKQKLSFFVEANCTKYFFLTNGIDHVSSVIEALKEKLNHREFATIDEKLLSRMMDYLIGLNRPILTEKVLEDIKRESNPLDFLNATT